MEELIKQAIKTLAENPYINEIELTNEYGAKIRLVRNAPSITYHSSGWCAPITNPYTYPK